MHATEAAILLYLENKLSSATSEELKKHFSLCGQCREQLVALLRLPTVIDSGETPPLDTDVYARAQQLGARKRPTLFRFSLSPYRKLALAFLGIIAVGASYFFLAEPTPTSRFRDPASATHTFIVHPPDGSILRKNVPTFNWSVMKNSIGYQVTIYRENGTILWQGLSRDTSLVFPADVALERGKTYLWRVETFFPDGSNFESKLNAFVYSP